jgi:hypothetical protein
MITNNFSVRANACIQSLIRMRSYLDKTHKTKGTISLYEAEINYLKIHLSMNGYRTDFQMAGFWLRHQEKIMWLIPGKNSSSHAAILKKYQDLTAEAFAIYQQYLITPLITSKETLSQCQH